MPLYIRDDDVNNLAEAALKLTGRTNKTALVKDALEAFIEAHSAQESLHDKVAKIQEKAAQHGIVADGVDDKNFMDDAWDQADVY
ncbi:MAG: type II toxin-antitoxin system VapB family antitoxin [Pelagimonas sp.]|jgi:antitoxin VapB|nr:type II toxin-antitoxin system VapB family antitoxin [Pelagimonas sp.]